MNSDRPRLTLTLPSELRMLCVARSFVEAACHTHGLDRAATHAIVLATGEAVSNIVRHAHHNRSDAQIQIECGLADNCFEVALYDEGEPFDLDTVPCLDPAELRVGGRGVYLMRALMDELTCQTRASHGNVLRMTKRVAIRECG
jgi:serine/threonine-protein kinase RsbW